MVLYCLSIDCVNRTRRIDPNTFCLGFPRYFTLFGSSDGSESWETQIATALLSSLFPFWGSKALFRLFTWLFFNLVMREQTLVSPALQTVSVLYNWHSGGCQYSLRDHVLVPSNDICAVVEEWTQGYFCLGYFSSSTHFNLVKGLARKVWRQCVLASAHGHGFRGGNCIGLLSNTGFLLSTGNRYLFLLQRQWFPFDSLPRLQIQFSHAWRQSFVNGVSDLYIFSPWFSTSDS